MSNRKCKKCGMVNYYLAFGPFSKMDLDRMSKCPFCDKERLNEDVKTNV